MEGDAQFTSGQLEDITDEDGNIISTGAISAYLQAVKVDPNNAQVWAQLARVQTYSSAMLVNLEERKARLEEALKSAEKAVELAPDDSYVHAIYAFTLDWNANSILIDDPRVIQKLLTDAEQEAARALQLDNTNTLALALSAEILVDQQKWTQAQQNIEKALASDSSLMDVHRVNAYVMESLGEYALAIESYDRAIAITPNLTFLHLYAARIIAALRLTVPMKKFKPSFMKSRLNIFPRRRVSTRS